MEAGKLNYVDFYVSKNELILNSNVTLSHDYRLFLSPETAVQEENKSTYPDKYKK